MHTTYVKHPHLHTYISCKTDVWTSVGFAHHSHNSNLQKKKKKLIKKLSWNNEYKILESGYLTEGGKWMQSGNGT